MAHMSKLQLQQGTKDIILAQENLLPGQVCMANNDENFGELFVGGKDGKAKLTKGGITYDTLFDGEIFAIGEYTISGNINDYKYINVSYGYKEDTSATPNTRNEIINLKCFDNDNFYRLYANSFSSNQAIGLIIGLCDIKKISHNKISIVTNSFKQSGTTTVAGNPKIAINKIIGIK